MRIVERLYDIYKDRAASARVTELTIGLGYTAVALDDGSVGLAFTWRQDGAGGCSFVRGWDDAEGEPATTLLDRILGDSALERSVGLATANALGRASTEHMPTDDGPVSALVREFAIERGTRVSMVGFFPPVARVLDEIGAELDVVDDARGMGDQRQFHTRLASWTQVLVMTSTALLGGTADEILAAAGKQVRAALLGPSTPLNPEAFLGLPVVLLAGMVPMDRDAVLRGVRHGAGTPQLQRFSRKVYCRCDTTRRSPA